MAKRRVSRDDVAKRANVSSAVVSYVINNGPKPVSLEKQLRVKKAIEELGYYPNELARSLRFQQSSTIGLLLPNLTNIVYAEIASGVESICSEHGYVVLVGYSNRDPVKEKKYINMVRAKQVDGVIMLPDQNPLVLVQPLQAERPIVIIEHDVPGLNCITMEHLEGGKLATQHLVGLGHRRIGLIRRSPGHINILSVERFKGYCHVLEQAGIPFDPALVIESGASQEEGYQAMQQLLALPDPPTAVFTHNDVLALGAMHAIWSAGLSIPGDISIIGFDDTAGSAYLYPPLTTIRFSKAEMGREAARILLQLIQQLESVSPRTIKLPVELVVRASTAPPPQTKVTA
ncbi:MAG: LacI family DNA-binding transcriptional regulator [Chloroflexi bacterium]|nr:LacI family DNA-binding transcriptional regulator [Chloroflexota bacterium]